MPTHRVPPSWLRTELVRRILIQFQGSMPIYEQMLAVAQKINASAGQQEAKRLGRIMHAAIRCATGKELSTINDLFGLLGCEPVNYYDLRERVSVESTAFRPTAPDEIERNGFRVFCSKFSLECIPAQHRGLVESIIARRNLFDAELLALIETGKNQNGFERQQALRFIDKSVELFSRPDEALVSLEEYQQLSQINQVAAQVLVTNSLAFNHLTPSVASVPDAHQELVRRGIQTIPVWQGPVGKDVILRQTSCLAPPITLKFPQADGHFVEAEYQETFVEFEERLQALTPRGRELLENLFDQGKQTLQLSESDPAYADHYYTVMREALADFPSNPQEIWRRKLAYFTFEVSSSGTSPAAAELPQLDFEALIISGVVRLLPQQYEDFFGPAATNIFNSNIGLADVSHVGVARPNSQHAFEAELGRTVVNMDDYYDQIQTDSKIAVCAELGL